MTYKTINGCEIRETLKNLGKETCPFIDLCEQDRKGNYPECEKDG